MKQSIKGTSYLVLASMFFGSYGVWSKLMGDSFGMFFQAWYRSLMIIIIVLIAGILTKAFKRIERRDRKWFAVFAIGGACTFAPYFYALQHLSLGTAVLLFYATLTLGTFILGRGFFNEKLTRVKIASLVLGFIGLFFIFSFSLRADEVFYGFLAMLAGAAGAVEVTFTKKVSDRYTSLQVTAVDFAAGVLVNLIISLMLHESWPQPAISTPWLAQMGYAVSQLAAFSLVVLGYKHVEASVAGVVGLLEIVFGVVFGIIIFQEPVTGSIILGGLCIILSAGLPNIVNFKK